MIDARSTTVVAKAVVAWCLGALIASCVGKGGSAGRAEQGLSYELYGFVGISSVAVIKARLHGIKGGFVRTGLYSWDHQEDIDAEVLEVRWLGGTRFWWLNMVPERRVRLINYPKASEDEFGSSLPLGTLQEGEVYWLAIMRALWNNFVVMAERVD